MICSKSNGNQMVMKYLTFTITLSMTIKTSSIGRLASLGEGAQWVGSCCWVPQTYEKAIDEGAQGVDPPEAKSIFFFLL